MEIGDTVKTKYKTGVIRKGEFGTVKELYDEPRIPKTALVDFRHSVVCFFERDLEVQNDKTNHH
ncbi:hypothetical protein ACFXD6_003094 [Listeria monocytogenes]